MKKATFDIINLNSEFINLITLNKAKLLAYKPSPAGHIQVIIKATKTNLIKILTSDQIAFTNKQAKYYIY